MPPVDFPGTSRFAVRRRIGEGGMGVVYLAHDRERGQDVALKTLARVDAAGITDLKNEFRALADVIHPNLVTLHELVFEGGFWFFTMEVVRGVSFCEHVRRPSADREDDIARSSSRIAAAMTQADRTLPAAEIATVPLPIRGPVNRTAEPTFRRRAPAPWCDIELLRPALRQLAEGVSAIHAAGKVHRDLKPSNVLVTPEGRVVILDFGLAMVHGARREAPGARSRLIRGTPAYMAPEQVRGDAFSPATDWYAVGAMLFQVLTGELPFQGDIHQILTAKRLAEPLPPAELAEGIPEDLNRLCVEWLRREPELRPSGADVLRRLGAGAPTVSSFPASSGEQQEPLPFVGREAQLAELRAAFEAVKGGRAVTVMVRGQSGMGKSALVELFLDELWRDEDALILAGRCFERESVPYKAWDSLIDALSQDLGRRSPEEVHERMPRHIHDLARIFPVLLGIEGLPEPTEALSPLHADQITSRRRAFDACKELLRRLARERPLVLTIDDLQWGDVDSAKLMVHLLSEPDPPPLLLLGSYRSEEEADSELFGELRALSADRVGLGEMRTIEVQELSPDDGARLARALLEASGGCDDALASGIARESEGSPFFIAELGRHVLTQITEAKGGATSAPLLPAGVSLETVLTDRIAALPEPARRLLEVFAVAARPLEQGVAAAAAGLEAGGSAAVRVLRGNNLIRTRGPRPRDLAEPYHDRVREVVAAGLDKARVKAHSLALARTLEASGKADPEELSALFEGAGELERAGHYAARAAEEASAKLAFDRAARLYRRALAWKPPGDAAGARALMIDLGFALVNAGRGAEAAPVFLTAAVSAEPSDALELRRRAAEQLLVSGHMDRGALVLRAVLASVGVSYPETSTLATLALLYRLGQLRLRGTRWKQRAAAEIPAAELSRIDVCYSAGKGLILVDPVRGLGFLAQQLLLALDAGDPLRVSLGLAFYGANLCVSGPSADARSRRILGEARGIAELLGEPYPLGVVSHCEAARAMCLGMWRETVERSARGNEILRAGCSGVSWEIEGGVVFSEVSLLWMGRLAELRSFVKSHVREALDRGDLFAATYARMHTWYAPIADDDVGRASGEMREAIGRWTQGGFHIMHFWALYGETQYALYAGDARAAWDRITSAWGDLAGSNILRVQFQRVFMVLLRGGVATAAALEGRSSAEQRRLLDLAAKDEASLAAEGRGYVRAMAALLGAGIEAARRRPDRALGRLDEAIRGLDAADMTLHAACARRRRGEILGGDQGRALIVAADALMTAQGIKDPARWTRIYAPGFDRG